MKCQHLRKELLLNLAGFAVAALVILSAHTIFGASVFGFLPDWLRHVISIGAFVLIVWGFGRAHERDVEEARINSRFEALLARMPRAPRPLPNQGSSGKK